MQSEKWRSFKEHSFSHHRRKPCNLDLNIFLKGDHSDFRSIIIFLDKLEMKAYLNKKEKKSAFCTKSAFWKYFFAIMT
jgi:hypothetical protein